MSRPYEYRHIVSFEETNLVGNVYYANHLRWQGRCREAFLREHTPELLAELSRDLCLVTAHCSCDYFAEVWAFDEIIIRMFIEELTQHYITMKFEYLRVNRKGYMELVAQGKQRIACMRRTGENTVPEPIPRSLRSALGLYSET
ncbi:MAG TPA: acyl-CoA thioesterase [Candidatus Bathyarchaeia archaeon]|jgi:enediyne biosynthesis thioesterase|nr:acyl-CoA thioesterase [Candidatus Bathyarchaeia archaeon]